MSRSTVCYDTCCVLVFGMFCVCNCLIACCSRCGLIVCFVVAVCLFSGVALV